MEPIEPQRDLEAQQIALERRQGGRGSVARRAQDEGALEAMARAVAAFTTEAAARNASRRPRAAALLSQFDDPVLAAEIALQGLVEAAARSGSLTAVAAGVGAAIESAARLRRARAVEERLFAHLERRGRRALFRRRRAPLLRALERQDATWSEWPARDRLLLGVKLTELAILSTGWFELTLEKTARGGRVTTRRVIQATEALTRAVGSAKSGAWGAGFGRAPMVAPPEPWRDVTGGGYLTLSRPPLPLVKTRSAAHLAELRTMNAPGVYDAVNTAQRTAWRVNRRILDLALYCLDKDLPLGGLAPQRPAPEPVRPPDLETNEAARALWRRSARLWRESERRRAARAVAFGLAIQTARRFSRFERLWLPHQYDFRGRLYPAAGLNPQGADPERALLEFAEGWPLGGEGWRWLAVHLANCGDFEKISKAPLAERIAWVFRNEERIRATAADPLEDRFWTEADKPWQFLAACLEWSAYVDMIEQEGEAAANAKFHSHLPVALDAACSGLQHFSLMLRDEVGGAAVNLTPKARSTDLYSEVAARVRALLQADLHERPEKAAGGAGRAVKDLARAWLDFGVDRELVKRPTMTFGYGARRFGFAEQILADSLSPRRALSLQGLADWPFEDEDLIEPARFLAERVARAIEGTVIKAAEAMRWLQDMAEAAARHDAPVRWTTPDGFLALQAYRETKSRMVHVSLLNQTMRLTLLEETERLDARRQKQGVAPNVIHSLDACHLRLTVRRAADEGIDAFALVHDSFATHAAHTPRFFQIIREAIVDLYEATDVAAALRRDIGAALPRTARERLPRPPAQGQLALRRVLEAEFAFA